VDDRSESVAVDENRRLVLRVHAGPFHALVDLRLTPTAADGTDLTMTERPVGAVAALTPLLRPWLYARNRRSMTLLRDLTATSSRSGGAWRRQGTGVLKG
jgi:hypothetical protein